MYAVNAIKSMMAIPSKLYFQFKKRMPRTVMPGELISPSSNITKKMGISSPRIKPHGDSHQIPRPPAAFSRTDDMAEKLLRGGRPAFAVN